MSYAAPPAGGRLASTGRDGSAYRENPYAFDNLGLLRNAPSDRIRQQIIQGRIPHLESEIRAFEGAIRRILGA